MSQSSAWTPRGGSDGAPAPGDLTRLLDRAHAVLSSEDLASLLLAVRRMIQPAERLAMDAVVAELAPPRPPAPRDHLAPCTAALARAASCPDGLEWLDAYLDEIAARPRGSASSG